MGNMEIEQQKINKWSGRSSAASEAKEVLKGLI